MNKIINQLKGDKTIWAVIILLAMVSFLPVYSASTNLVYTVGNGGTTFGILFKHFVHLSIGLGIVFLVHKLHFERFKKYAIFGMIVIVPALIFTLLQGKKAICLLLFCDWLTNLIWLRRLHHKLNNHLHFDSLLF